MWLLLIPLGLGLAWWGVTTAKTSRVLPPTPPPAGGNQPPSILTTPGTTGPVLVEMTDAQFEAAKAKGTTFTNQTSGVTVPVDANNPQNFDPVADAAFNDVSTIFGHDVAKHRNPKGKR